MASNPPPPSEPPPPPPPPGSPATTPSGAHPYAPQPSAQPPYTAQPYGYGAVAERRPFRRNPSLLLAQVLLIIQGILGLLFGAALILLAVAGNRFFSNINLHNVNGVDVIGAATSVLIGAGIVAIVIAILVIFGAVRVGRPSQVARWLLAIFEVLVLLGTLNGLQTANGGNRTLGTIIALVVEALVLFGLVIDPATYRAFARRNLP